IRQSRSGASRPDRRMATPARENDPWASPARTRCSASSSRSRTSRATGNGTVQDYMEIVMASPRVARNACQRLYDMILSYGFSEYTRHHERYVHYRLFDDPIDHGRDAVFGLDASLMRLVHNIKSAAFGYGT